MQKQVSWFINFKLLDMDYFENYAKMDQFFTSTESKNEFENVELKELSFESHSYKILPGTETYHCEYHDQDLKHTFSFYTDVGTIKNNVHIKDIQVEENQKFTYQMIMPKGQEKTEKLTFLFHGFNEKNWNKYLPWAKAICEGTQSAVVLFPIAFHMQRAPKNWSNKREMYKLSESRKRKFPYIVNSTLSNVAISMRLHSMPQRFIWSGLQTFYDVIQFVEECKAGNHPFVSPGFEFNIFAYSIGGFLAQILKFTNYNNYFSDSKICLFCSGTTFNRLSPVSKFILDSEANVALYSFLVEHFEKILKKDNILGHYINGNHPEGKIFYSMLDYQKMKDFRESLLKRYEHQIYALALKKDCIIPSFEIMNTLKGAYRDINIKVEELDFPYDYTHENPFPQGEEKSKQVTENFNLVFDKVCGFFNS